MLRSPSIECKLIARVSPCFLVLRHPPCPFLLPLLLRLLPPWPLQRPPFLLRCLWYRRNLDIFFLSYICVLTFCPRQRQVPDLVDSADLPQMRLTFPCGPEATNCDIEVTLHLKHYITMVHPWSAVLPFGFYSLRNIWNNYNYCYLLLSTFTIPILFILDNLVQGISRNSAF